MMAACVPRVGPWPLGLETTEKIFVHKELCLSILAYQRAVSRTGPKLFSLFCLTWNFFRAESGYALGISQNHWKASDWSAAPWSKNIALEANNRYVESLRGKSRERDSLEKEDIVCHTCPGQDMVRKDLRIYQAFTVTELQAQHKLKINTQFQLSVGRLNMEGVPQQRGHLQRRGEFFFSFFLLLLFSSFFHSFFLFLSFSLFFFFLLPFSPSFLPESFKKTSV